MKGRVSYPMGVDRFMEECLYGEEGYYRSGKVGFGRGGDFVTAPVLSSLFGELLGLWVIGSWEGLGKPASFCLCEGGGGSGILMGDIIRTLRRCRPEVLGCGEIVMLESSPILQKVQLQYLSSFGVRVRSISCLEELPKIVLIFLANELLDCFPIRQHVWHEGHWHEREVRKEGGCFSFGIGGGLSSPEAICLPCEPAYEGDILEDSPLRHEWLRNLSHHFLHYGGCGVLSDYGHGRSHYGDSLQSVKRHKYVGIFDSPGSSDITASVNFEAALSCMEQVGVKKSFLRTQRAFLLSLGLAERLKQLSRSLDTHEVKKLMACANRLTGEKEMGTLFKVLGVCG